jgi:threonine aldolase
LLDYLKSQGVLATGLIGLRFVTHLDVDAAGIDHTIHCIRQFFNSAGGVASPAAGAGVY